MLGFIEQLLAARNKSIETGCSVTLSIPLDDPRADKLRAVAKKLLLPTTTIRKSGLVTKTGIQDKARAEEFFDSLRGELGDELMEELEDDLRKQVALKQNDKVSDLSEDLMKNPAGIVSAILGDGGAVTGFDSGSAQTMANMASSIFKQGLGS